MQTVDNYAKLSDSANLQQQQNVDNRWIRGGNNVDNFRLPSESTSYPHSFPPVIHIARATRSGARAPAREGTDRARQETTITGTEVAIIIGAGTNAIGVILAAGQISGKLISKLDDMREDMRSIRQDIQSCLTTLIITAHDGKPIKPT